MILDCRPLAEKILHRLKQKPTTEKSLVAILGGADPASLSFVKQQKEKTAEKLGIRFIVRQFPVTIAPEALGKELEQLALDASVGGIILQLPLPPGFDRDALIEKIPFEKDVDALRGKDLVLPPAAHALKEILDHIHFDLVSARVAVVGRGFLVGAPIAAWLLGKAREVLVMDKDSFDPQKLLAMDLIVSGTGRPGLIRGEHVKPGAVCVDFGYGKTDGGLRGDFDEATVAPRVKYPTPVPGGMGPLLVAKLFENFFTLTDRK